MPDTPMHERQHLASVSRGPVHFGDVIYAPGATLGPRRQADFQLVILRSGGLDLELDGRAITVPPGSAILLYPGGTELFRFARETRTQHEWCSIATGAVPKPLRAAFRAAAGAVVPFGPAMSSLLGLGLSQGSSPGAEPEVENAYYLALGLALFCETARSVRQTRPTPPHADLAVAKAQAFVRAELGRALTLEEIARAAGVSRQHLLKLFRERGLPTPTAYLYSKRLETAADLLNHTGLAIAEIAERCGFANAFHFSRKFRAVHGLSPRAWRQTLWAGVPLG